MKKIFQTTISIIVVALTLITCNCLAFAAVGGETVEPSFPIADGIDLGTNNEENKLSTSAFWYSKYQYNSPSFNTGVYLNGGKSFTIKKNRSPYLEKATHYKTKNSNPSYYRVSYQMINSATGSVRKGVFFGGDISNLRVEFDVKEAGSYKFYIAGESRNTYTASGTLRY